MKKHIISIIIVTCLLFSTLSFGIIDLNISGKAANFDQKDKVDSVILLNNDKSNYLSKIGPYDFIPGELIIKFKPDVEIDELSILSDFPNFGVSIVDDINQKHQIKSIEKILKNKDKQVYENHGLSNIYKINFPKEQDLRSIM